MRVSVNISLDQKVLHEIDKLRGREKRSTFVEHLIKLGLEALNTNNPTSKTKVAIPKPKPDYSVAPHVVAMDKEK